MESAASVDRFWTIFHSSASSFHTLFKLVHPRPRLILVQHAVRQARLKMPFLVS